MAVYQFNMNPFGLFFIGIEMRSGPFKLLKYLLKRVIKSCKKCKVLPPTIIFTVNFGNEGLRGLFVKEIDVHFMKTALVLIQDEHYNQLFNPLVTGDPTERPTYKFLFDNTTLHQH